MAWYDGIVNNVVNILADRLQDKLSGQYSVLGEYYTGNQRPQLKTKIGKQDDNIILNFVALAVDRGVSRLFRGGIDFNLPEGAENQQEYLDTVWDLNKQEIILYQVGLHGAVYGTPYFKIVPDGAIDPYTDAMYPRLIALDPMIVRVETDPQDMNVVRKYTVEYSVAEERNGRKTSIGYREITRMDRPTDYEAEPQQTPGYWIVEYWERVGESGQWTLIKAEQWPYTFPPILHWKNLPSLKSCYGDSDIDDVINVQDKLNFIESNEGKIIKYHASPTTVFTGITAQEMNKEPAAAWAFSNPDAKAYNLTLGDDLASSRAFSLDLRQSIFDISREVDISSIADKLGTLTNFGLKVLYSDATDKNDTKRQLYGDALTELNRRLLVLAGWEGEESRPGSIQWGQALIVNVKEEIEVDQQALEMGIVDKQTIQQRYQDRYGIDWDTLQERLADEQLTANQNNNNVGAMALQNFLSGR